MSKPTPPKSWLHTCSRVLLRLARIAAVTYLGLLLVMLWLENYLIYPAPRYPDGDWNADRVAAEDVYFTSADGTKLHGWYFHHAQPRAHVLYCHGNGDCVAYHAEYLQRLSESQRIAIFSFDYRGYGRSEGTPSEAGVLQDSIAARDWLANRAELPLQQIVLMGRSLGGAVAVDLAAESGARGIILQNTFTSMPDVAAPMYWFLPVRLFMRTQYNSAAKIDRYSGPLLQSHGTADRLVPIGVGKKLFDLAPTHTKAFFPIDGGDHNDHEPEEYYRVLDRFLADLP